MVPDPGASCWMPLSPLSGSFILTSNGVTDCRSCSQPSGVRPFSSISWLVLLVMSMSTWVDFPFFTVSNVSEISKPLEHGLVSSGSNSTGVGPPTGPPALPVTRKLCLSGIVVSRLVVLIQQNSS